MTLAQQNKMKTQKIHPADLTRGDTILINGNMKTVGSNTVKTGFYGTLVDGVIMDKVEQVLFPKWLNNEITGYDAQI